MLGYCGGEEFEFELDQKYMKIQGRLCETQLRSFTAERVYLWTNSLPNMN